MFDISRLSPSFMSGMCFKLLREFKIAKLDISLNFKPNLVLSANVKC